MKRRHLAWLAVTAFACTAAASSAATPKLAILKEGYISDDDYPPEAIRNEEEGRVRIKFVVRTTGRVGDCSIEESSGSQVLDSWTCALIVQRFAFEPAKNEQGVAIEEWRTQSINWRLPKRTPARVQQFIADMAPRNVEIEIVVAPDGRVVSCKPLRFETPFSEKSDVACPWATGGKAFAAFPGPKNKRIVYRNAIEVTDVDP